MTVQVVHVAQHARGLELLEIAGGLVGLLGGQVNRLAQRTGGHGLGDHGVGGGQQVDRLVLLVGDGVDVGHMFFAGDADQGGGLCHHGMGDQCLLHLRSPKNGTNDG